jgi:hypothetical protein
LFATYDRRCRCGRTGEHRADGDPGRDAGGNSPALVRLVALASDHRAIPSNADEPFFTDRHSSSPADGHGALFADDDPTTPGISAVASIHVDVAVDVHVRIPIDVHVPIDVLVDVAVVVVAPVGAGVAAGSARLANRTARAAAIGGELHG